MFILDLDQQLCVCKPSLHLDLTFILRILSARTNLASVVIVNTPPPKKLKVSRPSESSAQVDEALLVLLPALIQFCNDLPQKRLHQFLCWERKFRVLLAMVTLVLVAMGFPFSYSLGVVKS